MATSANGHSGGIVLDAVQVTLPLRATLVLPGSGAILNWTGGVPPYRVQRANSRISVLGFAAVVCKNAPRPANEITTVMSIIS